MGATKRIRTSKLSPGEKSDILDFIEKGKSVQEAAAEFGRDVSTIRQLLLELRPTTTLARATLRARSAEILDHVIDKGDVDQLIDLLSRPNVGVLDVTPTPKGGGVSVGWGIAVSVSPGSFPAVNEVDFIDGQKRVQGELNPAGESKRISVGAPVGEFYT